MKDLIPRYKLIESGKLYDYYACSDGFVLRVLRSTYAEEKVKPYIAKGKVTVKINFKDVRLATAIARAFVPGHRKGAVIAHKDGDKYNCRADNLEIISSREHGRRTGGRNSRCRAVIVKEPGGCERRFDSVRQAAAEYFVSYQTMLDYMKKPGKRSSLWGFEIREE